MKPTEMKILCIGAFAWGIGDTLNEALTNMVKEGGKRTLYSAYIVHPDSHVTDMGSISYPIKYPPKLFHTVGQNKTKKAKVKK